MFSCVNAEAGGAVNETAAAATKAAAANRSDISRSIVMIPLASNPRGTDCKLRA